MYWLHIWWLNHAVERGIDCNVRGLYALLIIHCVDCCAAESRINNSTVLTVCFTISDLLLAQDGIIREVVAIQVYNSVKLIN
jgi:hypothetical protein